jgi:hypothetical protein
MSALDYVQQVTLAREYTYSRAFAFPLDFGLWHSEIWEIQCCCCMLNRLKWRMVMRSRENLKDASHSTSINFAAQCHFENCTKYEHFTLFSLKLQQILIVLTTTDNLKALVLLIWD